MAEQVRIGNTNLPAWLALAMMRHDLQGWQHDLGNALPLPMIRRDDRREM